MAYSLTCYLMDSYLHDEHKVDNFTGHTVVGKPEQELKAMSWKRTAKL